MHTPSLKKTAFKCPHCDAHTTQYWYEILVQSLGNNKLPFIPTEDFLNVIKELSERNDEKKRQKNAYISSLRKQMSRMIYLAGREETGAYGKKLYNVFASHCYNCEKWTIWANDTIIYPPIKYGTAPNQDLTPEILSVVEEARTIINLSPKGAAALLRLAIQMLCKHLGQSGKNLNDDIAELVKKGLNPMVQKALDIVRVIGNEAVHPGELNLNDNKDTAVTLFDLINTIADQMISNPKRVDAIYNELPQAKREAIAKRDGKKK